MKMTLKDFSELKAVVSDQDTPKRREDYRTGNFVNAPRVNDLDKRYRWDLFYDSFMESLTLHYSDAHIDTALRRIVPPIPRPHTLENYVNGPQAVLEAYLEEQRKRRKGLAKARKEVWRTAQRSGWDARLRETWTSLNDMIEEEL